MLGPGVASPLTTLYGHGLGGVYTAKSRIAELCHVAVCPGLYAGLVSITGPVSGLPNPSDATAGTPGQYPDTDQGLPYPPVNPSSTQRIAQMARLRLRDLPRPFICRQTCSGVAFRFELPVDNVASPNLQVVLTDTTSGGTTQANLGFDFVLDEHGGVLVFTQAPAAGLLMVAQGTYYRDLLPPELDLYIRQAYMQHTYDTDPTETMDTGYPPPMPPQLGTTGQPVTYGTPAPMMISEVEEYPISILVAVMALWDMAVGVAQQHDVHTPDGVTIPISQTFNQITQMIDRLNAQYMALSSALGVGLYRITQSRLRRVSRTTKRLVPIYRSKEYDDLTWPQREMPQIDVNQKMYTYRGFWGPEVNYVAQDLIDYQNRRYVALQSSTNIDPTRDVDPTTGSGYYWQWSTINTGWVGWW